MPAAVAFCNERLLGTLGCAVLIDEDTKKAHQTALDQDRHRPPLRRDRGQHDAAVHLPQPVPHLGRQRGRDASSSPGDGNFGNVLCFEHVEKSVIVDDFMSTGHMMNTNKAGFDAFAEAYSRYSVEPGWKNVITPDGPCVVVGGLRRKDF